MSLFPITGEQARNQPQTDRAISDNPAGWLSNNASYQPHDVLDPHHPYGSYATQAEFLRAAERYLESSSDSDPDGGGGSTALATQATKERVPLGGAHASSQPGRPDTQPETRLSRQGQPHHSHYARRSSSTSSETGDSDRDRRRGGHKKRKRRSSRSPSKSKRRRKRNGRGRESPEKAKKRRKRSHHRSTSSSTRDSDSPSDSRSDGNGEERLKILRLERAAAAAGIAPRQAAAISAGRPILKGKAPQPGDVYYDTRGDLDNVVYECLYGSNVASYHRTDPLGLVKGARAHRLLPGQITLAGLARGGDGDDASSRAAVQGTRYFGARVVATERSRRLRRVFLSEAPVLPGTSGPGRSRMAGGSGSEEPNGVTRGRGSSGAVQRGWLLSKLEGPAAQGRSSAPAAGGSGWGFKIAMPMPSYLPLKDPVLTGSTLG
ncbi:hypothetical protein Vafri_16733, partial [Volvox africanus]